MKIAIDIDDTIFDTRSVQEVYWKEYVNKNKITKFTEELPEDINVNWNEPIFNDFWDTYRLALAADLPIIKDTSECIKKLKQKNKIILLSSGPGVNRDNIKNIIKDRLLQYDISYNEYVPNIKDKGKYMFENNIDILIDDEISNINSALKYDKKGILFNSTKKYDGLKASDWLEVIELLNEII